MAKYTVSILFANHKLFLDSIDIREEGVVIKRPRVFKSNVTILPYRNIVSIDVETHIIGYASVKMAAGGSEISVVGFRISDAMTIAEQVKRHIAQLDR